MATMREATKALLTGDGVLMALLTGGVLDSETLPPDGGGTDDLPKDTDGVRILPFGVLRWRISTPTEIVARSERQFLEIWLYDMAGQSTLDQAKARIKTLMNRQQVAATDADICMFHLAQMGGDFDAPEYGHIPATYVRFYVDFTRG